ncbi:hypothetical protein GDO86_006462 [Hymenochirus boettgeri]|uniref:Lines homolog 1 n=1 Tax=Hymenochirus boettgeri TaxID=247094 RepID=A0A8T2J697_9PIPI|nr:hypothetical protein GDO86_006462 [Hymenochirus boettgeri]
MENLLPSLRELHTELLQAHPLQKDTQKYASLLAPYSTTIRSTGPICTELVSSPYCVRDITSLQLSLIQMLINKSESKSTEPEICLSTTSDMVLSNLSSKCLSCLVLFQLKCKKEVNIQWIQFCLKSLNEFPRCFTLLPCLSSLVYVCQGILRDETPEQRDILLSLLQPFHPVFEGFCSSMFSAINISCCQSPALDPKFNKYLACLLELLEVLVALRIHLKLNLPLCRKVVSVTIPQALVLISSPVLYFVKKQLILLLKRSLLKKVGEDFFSTQHSTSQTLDPLFEQDLQILGEELLKMVHQGWLLQVPVNNKISSFGGFNETSERSPDLVVLGAVCLSVLRALEIQLLEITVTSIIVEKLQTFMENLLIFLKHHLEWREPLHLCEWVTLTFIEQDDDMLEVANILLKIYVHCETIWFQASSRPCHKVEVGIWSGLSHMFGSDPHCVFLLIMNNLAFDSSVLLDFLISSETCFLEYFVRYLKLLKKDWPRFCLSCTLFDLADFHQVSKKGGGSISPSLEDMVSVTGECSVSLQASLPSDTHLSVVGKQNKHISQAPECILSLGALQNLTAYDSSEDSGSECAEQGPIPHNHIDDNTDIHKEMGKLELKGGYPDFHIPLPPTENADSTNHFTGTQKKCIRCLEELQKSIDTLQRKKLFPYNPSALLRLLVHVLTLNKDMREGKISH